MILRTKDGLHFNTDKIWSVESMVTIDGKRLYGWNVEKKYITQRRMLQALRNFRANNYKAQISHDGGETYEELKKYYRPAHVCYDYELRNLCNESLREYKLNKLL